jgi:hypothetical protein
MTLEVCKATVSNVSIRSETTYVVRIAVQSFALDFLFGTKYRFNRFASPYRAHTVAMPTSIEVCYSVSVNNSCQWKLDAKDVSTIDGNHYVVVDPNGSSFVRMVLHGSDNVPSKKAGWRPTLANAGSYIEMMALRNAAVADLIEQKSDDVLNDLFGTDGGAALETPPNISKPPPKLNATQLKAIRAAKQAMEFELPGVNGNPSLSVSCAIPAHPRDHIILQLDPDTVDHVVMFLRHRQSIGNPTGRRSYREFEVGVWRNGSAGVVRKIDGGDDGVKFKRMRKSVASQGESATPLEDDGDAEPDSPVRALDDLVACSH